MVETLELIVQDIQKLSMRFPSVPSSYSFLAFGMDPDVRWLHAKQALGVGEDDIVIYHAGANDALLANGFDMFRRDRILSDMLGPDPRIRVLCPFTHANSVIAYLVLGDGYDPSLTYDLRVPALTPQVNTAWRKLLWGLDDIFNLRAGVSVFDLLSTKTYGTYTEAINARLYGVESFFMVGVDTPLYGDSLMRNLMSDQEKVVSDGVVRKDGIPSAYSMMAKLLREREVSPQPCSTPADVLAMCQEDMSIYRDHVHEGDNGYLVRTVESGHPVPFAISALHCLHLLGYHVTAIVENPQASNTYLRAHEIPMVSDDLRSHS